MRDAVEANEPLLHQVEESARRGDHDVRRPAQGDLLAMLAHAAVEHGVPDVDVTAVDGDLARDLRRELARRGQDQAGDAGGPRPSRELLKERQHERGGLPGAGLRGGEHVAALERDRHDLALDGRGLGVVFLEHGAHQGLHEAESGERGRRNPLDRLRKQRLARRVLGRVRDRAVGDEGGTSRPAASPKGPAAATIMHETQWITLSRGGARTSAQSEAVLDAAVVQKGATGLLR